MGQHEEDILSRLGREDFIAQFQNQRIQLDALEADPELTSNVRSNLRRADLNQDGVLAGRSELDAAFSRLDQYDRDGSHHSIIVERSGERTALGRVVDALANRPGQASSNGRIEVALQSVERGLVTLERGSKGGTVDALQQAFERLGFTIDVDGEFGPQTESVVMRFQRQNGLVQDGIVGPQTAQTLLAALRANSSHSEITTPVEPSPTVDAASWSAALSKLIESGTLVREGQRGADVRALQEGLQARGIDVAADGVFGPATRSALQAYQWSRGLSADGVAGPQTYRALVNNTPAIERNEPTPSDGNPIDIFPVAGGRFNVGYDANWNNFDYETAYHNSDFSLTPTDANHPNGHLGVDVFAPLGAPIVAPVSGEVMNAGYSSLGGYNVTIRRGDVYYYHAHLDSLSSEIRPGMMVNAGDYLGGNGASGSARGTEPHLHFSMYRGAGNYSRNPINPFPAMNAAIMRGSVIT